MMTEISLNILDVAQNSVKAKASLIEIEVVINTVNDRMKVSIIDNGCGMTEQQVEKVIDPFFTTRTTRKVGLGVSFFKLACECTGGSFSIKSEVNVGTTVVGELVMSHIDRMPLGDMSSTMHALITMNKDIDFLYSYQIDENGFTLDTREFREILGDIDFDIPEVSTYIKEYLIENKSEIDKAIDVNLL